MKRICIGALLSLCMLNAHASSKNMEALGAEILIDAISGQATTSKEIGRYVLRDIDTNNRSTDRVAKVLAQQAIDRTVGSDSGSREIKKLEGAYLRALKVKTKRSVENLDKLIVQAYEGGINVDAYYQQRLVDFPNIPFTQ